MKQLLVVWHSATGGTRQMAETAARAAAAEPGVAVRLLHAPDAGPAEVLAADGYVFATPENLASMAGLMKDFFDRCYYPALDQVAGRPCGVMVCAGHEGEGAARQLTRILTGWRLRLLAEPLIIRTHATSAAAIAAPKCIPPEALARCEDLGATLAAALAMGLF